MTITVLYFATARANAGMDSEVVVLPEGATVGATIEHLVSLRPGLTSLAPSLMAAVNEEWSPRERELRDGDTLALMPPVSGG